MGEENRSRRLQKSIIISSALGILAVGVIVGLASMLPLYRHLKKVQEDHLMWILATKRVAVEDILSKAAETASKIAASPEVTSWFDETKAVMGQESAELRQSAVSHALRILPMVRGINVLDEQGHLVVHAGADSAALVSRVRASTGTTFFGLPDSRGSRYFAVAVPIYDRAARNVGTNVVTFQTSDLEKAVEDHGGLGATGATIFGAVENDRIVPILQSRQNSGSDSHSKSTESAFELAIRRTALKQAGVLIPGKDHAGPEIVAYTPIRAGQWGIAVKMDKDELYAPVYPHIISTFAIIGVLILAGTFGVIVLVRPLTGKMVIHADELERQVTEKVKIIDDLYEHIVQSEKTKVVAEHTAEVAHELRQPLAIIGGFARRMIKQFDSTRPCDASQRESCRIIVSEIQRLEKILGGLIDFTRRKSLRLEKVAPNDTIEHVLNVHECKLKDKSLNLETSLSSDIGAIYLDRDRFEHLVRNLVANAIEASPARETIRIRTFLSVPSEKTLQTGELESKEYFEMRIENHGPVIPPEYLQKIFSPFFTTKDVGEGIGLTVIKRIVEDHNGSISVKSNEGGTVFTVWLPAERELLEPS